MAGWRKLHVIELMNTLAIDSHCAEGARRAGYGALAPKAPAERAVWSKW